MDKRYQVFISSTYTDLKLERQKVIQTLMEMDCIPAGMELFPAADEEQFEFIKKVIDDCDYYLLILGGRYGSLTSEGISYTEMEYEYALSIKLKVIAFIHGSPGNIPSNKTEQKDELKDKFNNFRDKVAENRIVKFWTEANELPGLVALSLNKAIKQFPAVGWVRADTVASQEILYEINELRKTNSALLKENKELSLVMPIEIENLADFKDTFKIHSTYNYFDTRTGFIEEGHHVYEMSWEEIFASISPIIHKDGALYDVKKRLTNYIKKCSGFQEDIFIDYDDFETIGVQFRSLGLIVFNYDNVRNNWSLTKEGEDVMMKVKSVKKS